MSAPAASEYAAGGGEYAGHDYAAADAAAALEANHFANMMEAQANADGASYVDAAAAEYSVNQVVYESSYECI